MASSRDTQKEQDMTQGPPTDPGQAQRELDKAAKNFGDSAAAGGGQLFGDSFNDGLTWSDLPLDSDNNFGSR